MTSVEGRLKSAFACPTQKRTTGLLQIPGLVTQPSPTDQLPFTETPTRLVGIMCPLVMLSSAGVTHSAIFAWYHSQSSSDTEGNVFASLLQSLLISTLRAAF
jgi:hypothetical protein